ncbi:hypothetical protein niasHS_018023 [Heterodera schachtii]|uniref:Uncharacterized protein n=1 Tax=Heterodera schachtii TaxID=97005 RepID=A0ABD2HSY5_HETSC
MNHFCFVGIYAGLAMLMLMLIPSSIADGFEIKVHGDKNMIIYVNDTKTVLKVKEMIMDKLRNNIDDEIRTINKELIDEEIKAAKLEEKKNELKNIVPARITLRLKENGSPLEDDEIMKDCGTVKGTFPNTIYLTLDELKIEVKGGKNTIFVYIKKGTDTVPKMKEKIVEKLNSRDNNKKTKIMSERLTLRPYKNGLVFGEQKPIEKISFESGLPIVIYMTLDEFEIKVKCEQKMMFSTCVNDTDTVNDLKEKIWWYLKIIEGIHGFLHTKQELTRTKANGVVG